MSPMKKILFYFLVFFLNLSLYSQHMRFFINQLGYYPESNKVAIIKFSEAESYSIIRLPDSTTVWEGNLSNKMFDVDSGDTIRKADFSNFKLEGTFVLKLSTGEISLPFIISKDILREVAYSSLRTFYYQRCSYEIKELHGGIWKRKLGHPDTTVIFHTSTGRSGKAYSAKGWYDAGDYNKYVVNAGISVANLLQLYELIPQYFADSSLNIPESGNGINDLLDEVKFELDWLSTMQDTDGGVFHKVTTANFSGFIMPEEDVAQRYFVGKGTAATLDFAAMMALAGRIYREIDSTFANTCIQMAEKAWLWAINNPNKPFKNPSDIFTGEYGDGSFDDEFLWAASELFISTGKIEYLNYLKSKSSAFGKYSVPGWPNVAGLGFHSLAIHSSGIDNEFISKIKNSIINACNQLINEISNSPFRITKTGFFWGSNGAYAQAGVTLIYGFILSNDSSYLKAATELCDYLLGKNATGYSFFTYYGSVPVMNPHHRPSYADKIIMPIPGFLSGGPNPGRQDNVSYPFLQPAKSFVDIMDSYASNEVAINWNAPATFLLAAIDYYLGNKNHYIYQPIMVTPNSPPAITISYPKFGAKITQNDSIALKFSVSDPENNASYVEIFIDSKYYTTVPATLTTIKIPTLKIGEHVITLFAFDSDGKGHEKSVRFSITSNVKIEVKIYDENLKIFPNPSENCVHITALPPHKGRLKIEIHSIDGKKVYSLIEELIEPTPIKILLDVSNFPQQTYLIAAFIDEKNFANSKMIVKR